MPGRGLYVLALCLAACSASAPPVVPPTPEQGPPAAARARLFQGPPDEAFWVSRGSDVDRVIAGGTRFELTPSGEVTAAVWDLELARRGDPPVGALAVPERLGGGFVHWSKGRVFRSRAFTGALEPIAVDAGVAILGARAGLRSVVVFTDGGPRALAGDAVRLAAHSDAGVFDMVAATSRYAAKLDVFGRLFVTEDGGASFVDVSHKAGTIVRRLAAGDGEVFVDTWDRRFVLRPSAGIELVDADMRPSHDGLKAYQVAWKGLGATARDDLPWGAREAGPLAAVVAGGATLGDGTGLGVVQGNVLRVELASGKLRAAFNDGIPAGLVCQPVRAPDGVLLACVWERYQSYGGCVLRVPASGPLEVEKLFSDDGSYVTDDHGALGFVGSCRAEARYFDPEEQARGEGDVDSGLRPLICVRRGPGEWVEHRVEVDDGALAAWVAGRDGSAVAIVQANAPLPLVASYSGRVTVRSGVRVVRVHRETEGWVLSRSGYQPERAGVSAYVDRRARLRDDGSIDLWLTPRDDGSPPVAVGATIDPRGMITVHDPAPGMIAAAVGGDFGVVLAADGGLYETTDHGRTFRASGVSPVSPTGFTASSCTALGCTLGPVVRLGWGEPSAAPRVTGEPVPEVAPVAPSPRLSCVPRGAPEPVDASPASSSARRSVGTGWGATLYVERTLAEPDAQVAPAKPAPKKPASPAVRSTHTIFFQSPFEPRAPVRRVNVADASFNPERRCQVTPLLGPSGVPSLLVMGETIEMLLAGERLTTFPAFEPRRWARSDVTWGGLATASGRAMVLGSIRRRLALEDHGPGARLLPVLAGLEQQDLGRRPMSLARRDDGTIGVLVMDGAAPETVGVAIVERASTIAAPVMRLAGWSTVTTADEPACRTGTDRDGFRAIVMIDPSGWFSLDSAKLPGFELGRQGMALVRWGEDRVCLEALDMAMTSRRRRVGRWSLAVRWAGEGELGAALWAADLRQGLSCRVEER